MCFFISIKLGSTAEIMHLSWSMYQCKIRMSVFTTSDKESWGIQKVVWQKNPKTNENRCFICDPVYLSELLWCNSVTSMAVTSKSRIKRADPSEWKDTSLFQLGHLFNTCFRWFDSLRDLFFFNENKSFSNKEFLLRFRGSSCWDTAWPSQQGQQLSLFMGATFVLLVG